MMAVKSMDIRDNFKDWCNKIIAGGETVIISRPKNENVIMMSEKEYNELQKAKRNADYLSMIDRSMAQLERGEIVVKSMEELDRMAK